MALLLAHGEDCRRIIGHPWSDVHLWLDELCAKYGSAHRRHRHHVEGIEEVRKMWGNEAATAAKIHIIVDCFGIPSQADYEYGWVDANGYSPDATPEDAKAMLSAVQIEIAAKHYEQAWEARKEVAQLQAALREYYPEPPSVGDLEKLKQQLKDALAFVKKAKKEWEKPDYIIKDGLKIYTRDLELIDKHLLKALEKKKKHE